MRKKTREKSEEEIVFMKGWFKRRNNQWTMVTPENTPLGYKGWLFYSVPKLNWPIGEIVLNREGPIPKQ